MMRKVFIYLILSVALYTGCKSGKSYNEGSASDMDSTLVMKVDEMQKEIARLNANFETLVHELYVDSLTYKEVKLSQGYSVLFVPQREYYDGRLSIHMNYWLKGNGEKVLQGDWYRTDEITDLKDYFIMFRTQGKPIEFDLYEKKTGRHCLHGSSLSLNIQHEAFIYYDYPDGDDKYYIYDLKTGTKTPLILPDQERYPWVIYGNAYESVFIKNVRNGHYILSSKEDDDCEFVITEMTIIEKQHLQ